MVGGAALLAAAAVFYAVNYPAAVSTAATTRQLPIYSVERAQKVCAISFDAAWGEGKVRHGCREREQDRAINAWGIRLSSLNTHQGKAAKSPCRRFTDYNKMKKLIQLDKLDGDRKGVIRTIAEKGEIVTTLYDTFPARMITDPQVFPSLLFYYGMLTIKATRGAKLILGIPNNNVRKQYDKYLSTDMLQPQE